MRKKILYIYCWSIPALIALAIVLCILEWSQAHNYYAVGRVWFFSYLFCFAVVVASRVCRYIRNH